MIRLLRAISLESPIPVPEDVPGMSFADAQKAVGGLVEVVQTLPQIGGCLLVNEEGRLRGLPVNLLASALAGQMLFGDAVQLMDAAAITQVLGTDA